VRWLRYWLEGLVVIALMVMTVVTFLQVLFRFVFELPSSWTGEVVTFSFIFVVFLGAALAVKHHEHIVVDIVDALPSPIKKTIYLISQALVLIFLFVFTYYGWQHAVNSMNTLTPSLEIPKGYIYMVAPFSGMLMIYYLIRSNFKKEG
jgi:TRAP-type C4-dicarboxylate transport system permease small subunit